VRLLQLEFLYRIFVVPLPEAGIRSNTHFPFSDLSNIKIADLMSKFLKEKGLD
jgi:hypothetical protein